MAIDRITTGAVLDGAIATADIADDAVTGAKLANDVAIANDLAVANDLTVDTNTLFVDASADKVGINQTSPTYQLSVLGASQSTVEIESASTTGESRLYMTDPDATGVGEIGYYHNGDTMRFNTGGAERMRLSSAGLHIGGTGAANALDDYEEGTWTPTFSAGISSPVYSIQSGRYTKVGRAVYVESDIRVTGGSVTSAHVYMGGLPFTVSSAAPYSKLDIIYQGGFHNISYPSVWLCIAGTTTAAFYRNTDGGAILGNQITSSFTNATIRIGGWYIT